MNFLSNSQTYSTDHCIFSPESSLVSLEITAVLRYKSVRIIGGIIQGETEILGDKGIPVPFYPPHMSWTGL
jgi:hypothetical protein